MSSTVIRLPHESHEGDMPFIGFWYTCPNCKNTHYVHSFTPPWNDMWECSECYTHIPKDQIYYSPEAVRTAWRLGDVEMINQIIKPVAAKVIEDLELTPEEQGEGYIGFWYRCPHCDALGAAFVPFDTEKGWFCRYCGLRVPDELLVFIPRHVMPSYWEERQYLPPNYDIGKRKRFSGASRNRPAVHFEPEVSVPKCPKCGKPLLNGTCFSCLMAEAATAEESGIEEEQTAWSTENESIEPWDTQDPDTVVIVDGKGNIVMDTNVAPPTCKSCNEPLRKVVIGFKAFGDATWTSSGWIVHDPERTFTCDICGAEINIDDYPSLHDVLE